MKRKVAIKSAKPDLFSAIIPSSKLPRDRSRSPLARSDARHQKTSASPINSCASIIGRQLSAVVDKPGEKSLSKVDINIPLEVYNSGVLPSKFDSSAINKRIDNTAPSVVPMVHLKYHYKGIKEKSKSPMKAKKEEADDNQSSIKSQLSSQRRTYGGIHQKKQQVKYSDIMENHQELVDHVLKREKPQHQQHFEEIGTDFSWFKTSKEEEQI